MATTPWTSWIISSSWMAVISVAVLVRRAGTVSAGPGVQETKEYCQNEYFSAACAENHVIIMETAIFGRMEIGRCVKGDYGVLGCSADVMPFVDSQCSGRNNCEFLIYSSRLMQMTPCPEDMASYLDASYSCLKVSDDYGKCGVSESLPLSAPTGYISSLAVDEYNYGTTQCPWHIQASPGQTISLRMLKYAKPMDRSRPTGSCYEIASVRDLTQPKADPERITTCNAEKHGYSLYESHGHELEVVLVGPTNLAMLGRYVMEYKVTGCADIKTPVNATWRRDGSKLEVRCNNTDRTWFLVCKDNRWHGDLGNCSHDDPTAWGIGQILRDSEFPYGILIVVAIGVALGIFCGGLLLTCAYMYMKRRRRAHRTALSNTGQETLDERFIVPEENFPPPPEECPHHHQLTSYTDVHLKGHEECFLHSPCTDNDKQISLVYTKTKTLKPGMGTIHGRHLYETPKFV